MTEKEEKKLGSAVAVMLIMFFLCLLLCTVYVNIICTTDNDKCPNPRQTNNLYTIPSRPEYIFESVQKIPFF